MSILIVDDEASVRESLRQILMPVYEVHTAANGKEALQCVRGQSIDLVILDPEMPGMSGIGVLRKIKKIKDDIEVILLTANGNQENAGEALYYGASDFIVKPFNISAVLAMVNQSLERQQNGVKIKNLIQQIKDLIPQGDNGNEEKLLDLSRDLCAILERGDSSCPISMEEIRSLEFNPAASTPPLTAQPASE